MVELRSFGSHMAQLHAETYEKHEISAETLQYFEQLAVQSLQQQEQLEQDSQISFDQYLEQYR